MLYIVDVLKERPEKIVSVRTTKNDHEMMLIRLQNNKIYLNWHNNQFSYKETGRIAHYIQRFMKHDDRPLRQETRKISSLTCSMPFLTTRLYQRSYFITPKVPSD